MEDHGNLYGSCCRQQPGLILLRVAIVIWYACLCYSYHCSFGGLGRASEGDCGANRSGWRTVVKTRRSDSDL